MADKNYYRGSGPVQALTIAVTTTQSAAFGAQTTHVRLATPAVGVWYLISTNPVVTVSNGVYLPPNWVDYVEVAPGEKIACIQPTAPAGTFNVVELIG